MQKKLLSLSFLLTLIWPCSALLNSCGPANCRPKQCSYVNSLDVKIIDNGDSIPHDVSNNELYAKALMMQINITTAFTTDSLWLCQQNTTCSPFITTASAMKKECDESASRDFIDSFRIISNHDFDTQHPAGTDLQDIFYSSSPVTNHTAGSPGTDNLQGLYTYYMRQAPADTGTHVFTVTMYFNRGKVLSQSTSPVKLLK